MIKALATALAATAFLSLSAAAAPVKMTNAALDQVAGGYGSGCENGNNGWGNGSDPSNAGSDNGGTASSKTANVGTDINKINTNPTTSTGR